MAARSILVWLHRWIGLGLAGFLVLVSLTGSLLAFLPELNRLLAPKIWQGPRLGVPLDPAQLARSAENLVHGARANTVFFRFEGDTAAVGMEAQPGLPPLDFTYLYLDPVTGEELGRLPRAGFPTTLEGVMPFVYSLHDQLAMGATGVWVLGIVALLWTIDCFISFYLTLPAASFRESGRFFARWRPAWRIKARGSFFRLNFDLHRASGLWLWGMLFVFAWSSTSYNLTDVYASVMGHLFDYELPVRKRAPGVVPASGHEPMPWERAQEIGQTLMDDQARERGFSIQRPMALYILRNKNLWEYRVRSSLDVGEKYGHTSVYFDAYAGDLRYVALPSTQHFGNTITTWIHELHKANLFGLPYRIFVCFLGCAITTLSITGVYIWHKKRIARFHHARARRGRT